MNSGIISLKLVAVKFGIAMGGVVFFSLLLYVGLSIYNKFFVDNRIKDYNLRQNSFMTPRDKDEAIMSFITRNRLK